MVLTMQLKVCNPHLILSVWTKDVMKHCTTVTDASLLKDWSLSGIGDVILQSLKRRAEETSACLHELWDECFGRKRFFSCIYLLKKESCNIPTTARTQRFPASWSSLAKKSLPTRRNQVTHFTFGNTSLSDMHAPSLSSTLAFCFLWHVHSN